jgi:hypothetical protein
MVYFSYSKKGELKMFRLIIAVLFVLVLVADFVRELDRKEARTADLLIRLFMIIGFAVLVRG